MVAKTLLDDVLSLSVADRRELVEHLWESLQADPNAIHLTEEQADALDRRAAEMDRDPTLGSSWEDVKARVCPKQ
jgi:putative addiction module component (TIGR02574 family)